MRRCSWTIWSIWMIWTLTRRYCRNSCVMAGRRTGLRCVGKDWQELRPGHLCRRSCLHRQHPQCHPPLSRRPLQRHLRPCRRHFSRHRLRFRPEPPLLMIPRLFPAPRPVLRQMQDPGASPRPASSRSPRASPLSNRGPRASLMPRRSSRASPRSVHVRSGTGGWRIC